jgi:hypothetical protein
MDYRPIYLKVILEAVVEVPDVWPMTDKDGTVLPQIRRKVIRAVRSLLSVDQLDGVSHVNGRYNPPYRVSIDRASAKVEDMQAG